MSAAQDWSLQGQVSKKQNVKKCRNYCSYLAYNILDDHHKIMAAFACLITVLTVNSSCFIVNSVQHFGPVRLF